MNQETVIHTIRKIIESDPHKNNIQSIRLFGSFLHGDATDQSDIDLLVEFKKNVGFFTMMSIQNRLEDNIGRPVQLMTKNSLSPYFRDEVLNEAKLVY